MNLLVISGGLRQGMSNGFPLGLLYLGAMNDETTVLDLTMNPKINIAKYIKEHRPKIVGATMYTPNRHEALRILKIAKNNGAITVAGGPHVSVMIKHLVKHYGHFVDHFVLGDGEFAWRDICEGTCTDQVIKNPVFNLDEIPIPKWDLVDWEQYQLGDKDSSLHGLTEFRNHNLVKEYSFPIDFGRGCLGKCAFCSTWWVNGKYNHHGKEWMDATLESIWNLGPRRLNFIDDALTTDRDAIFQLCDSLEKYDFAWWGSSKIDDLDAEMAQRMSDVGCFGLAFGIETFSEKISKRMNKQISSMDKVFETRQICKDANLYFRALMMRGFPGMTPQICMEDDMLLNKLDPDDVGSISTTWVFPGTTLHTKCKRRGLITDDFWLGPEPHFICPVDLEWENIK